jgi:hypothetical protein
MKAYCVSLAVVLILLCPNARSQWVQTTGPFIGGVPRLAVTGTNLVAVTKFGVSFSIDNGTTWTLVNSGLTTPEVSVLAVSRTNLFAGTYHKGVLISSDNGTNWAPADSGLTNKWFGRSLVLLPVSRSISGVSFFVTFAYPSRILP